MGRVLTPDALLQEVRQARAAGRTIAFANGCFDLLHVGHVRYLQGAADEADVLIVAVNDDASVQTLKGSGRPVVAAEHRAELVAALRCVDYAVVLSEAATGSLLETVRPDVLCAGTDDGPDHGPDGDAGAVPHRERVRAQGGRVAIVGGPKDHSSRDLLTRIAAGSSGALNPGGGQ